MYNCLRYESHEGVARIWLNRPDRFNAFNNDMSYELQDALKQVHKDGSIRVVVLGGEGKAFCSGQDLKDIAGTKRSLSDSLYQRYNPIIRAMRGLAKPIVCRLHGVAAGAGCSLALACDFVVASHEATLIEVFVNVGLVLDSGSSFFLPRLVGSNRAFELATMGGKVSAQQAFDWGMINRVVAAEELDNELAMVVDYYRLAPTKAIGLMKSMLNRSMESNLESMLQYEAYCQEIAGYSQDYAEGVQAFTEKRKPRFGGR
ncbi:MAG: enoyl-CoA hydratase/isomerase family protein [Bacteroidetes bacterium]|jgi:2-(1,2-epoxy-1,2-dihydrophenyl)acetyl-CoA isomerase|nr:enoyl-CoA hydratase/isomerase family protein [Bacteroidota bacterium]